MSIDQVGRVGFGLAGLTVNPAHKLTQSEFNTILRTVILNRGFQEPILLNSGEFYGVPEPNENLQKLGSFFRAYPECADQVFVSVKGGISRGKWDPDVTTENLKRTLETIKSHLEPLYSARRRLPRSLDLFTLARVGDRPIESTLEDLDHFRGQGYFRALCLSEVGAESIQKASQVTKLAAVEIEFSLFVPDAAQNGVFEVLRALNIPAVCYSPLGMGLLTENALEKINSGPQGPSAGLDRFKKQFWEHNKVLFESAQNISLKLGVTVAKLALSYITTISDSGRYPHLIPIPGGMNSEQQLANMDVIHLSQPVLDEIASLLSSFKRQGLRYNAAEEPRLWN